MKKQNNNKISERLIKLFSKTAMFEERKIELDRIVLDIQLIEKQISGFRNMSELRYVDMTPNDDLIIRILKNYRAGCDIIYSDTTGEKPTKNLLMIELNKCQKQRAQLLDKAIKLLKSKMIKKKEFKIKEYE